MGLSYASLWWLKTNYCFICYYLEIAFNNSKQTKQFSQSVFNQMKHWMMLMGQQEQNNECWLKTHEIQMEMTWSKLKHLLTIRSDNHWIVAPFTNVD